MSKEQLRILKMIRNGQITVEEGAQLLESLKKSSSPPAREPRQLRILVTDLETGQQKINLSLPWRLVSVGVDMGARFTRKEINLQDLVQAARSGAEGKIMDMIDEEDKEQIQVFVE